MAFQLEFDGPEGVLHTQAYAKVVQTNFDHQTKIGHVQVYIYHNQQSADINKLPIATRSYMIDSLNYIETFSPEKLDKSKKNLVAVSYDFIKARKEVLKNTVTVVNGKFIEGGVEIPEENAKESFFSKAIDV